MSKVGEERRHRAGGPVGRASGPFRPDLFHLFDFSFHISSFSYAHMFSMDCGIGVARGARGVRLAHWAHKTRRGRWGPQPQCFAEKTGGWAASQDWETRRLGDFEMEPKINGTQRRPESVQPRKGEGFLAAKMRRMHKREAACFNR